MSALGDSMKRVLADTFALYLKAQNFHWNVEGPDFYQYHGLFGDLYEEVYGAVDSIAEHIRAINEYAPGSFTRFKELSTIDDELKIPNALEMIRRLLGDNQRVIDSLTSAYKEAETAQEIGLANYLQDRIDIHKKHGWMLRATVNRAPGA